MRTRSYLRMLWRNGFQIHLIRLPMALILFPVSILNSCLYRLQYLFYQRSIQQTEIDPPPIFILGHWRSGTTHLHELMIRDDRFAFPSTYECFAPFHFLVTGWILPKLLWFMLPSKRPMDNMRAGFERPQEDEFGLVAMGAPTIYYRTAFPNRPVPYMETLNMEGLDEKDLTHFQEALLYFLKALTVRKQKRLVLKSPPHTGRIGLFAKMFPGAKFVHISRDPYAIFPSMKHAWAALDEAQGFQRPRYSEAEFNEFVFTAFERMYDGFEKHSEGMAAPQLCHVRYEDLVRDPVGEVRKIYETLELGDFEHMRPELEAYVASLKDYKPNRLEVEPELKAQIDQRWGTYIRKYGYGD